MNGFTKFIAYTVTILLSLFVLSISILMIVGTWAIIWWLFKGLIKIILVLIGIGLVVAGLTKLFGKDGPG